MKTLIFALVLLGVCSSPAQPYAINWWTIAGGGGASANGPYALQGTIGQAASGVMAGGAFTLTGGFWALPVAVQTPDGPQITITPAAPGFANIAWLPATPGFVLQESLTIDPTSWADAPSGTNNPALVPATLPVKYYRVFKP